MKKYVLIHFHPSEKSSLSSIKDGTSCTTTKYVICYISLSEWPPLPKILSSIKDEIPCITKKYGLIHCLSEKSSLS